MASFPIYQVALPVVLLGGTLLYRYWMTKRMRSNMTGEDGRAAAHRFFETTGYRYRTLPDGDVAAQTDEYVRRLTQAYAGARYEGEMTRELDGMTIWYRFGTGGNGPLV